MSLIVPRERFRGVWPAGENQVVAAMHIIKKYANRKLYHTNQKQYITLDGIARLVQEGESVQVLDNESGEEITPSILAQVALQARGRSMRPLPTHLLTGLIQAGGDTLSNLRRTLFASLGGPMVDSEIGRRLDKLAAEGSLGADEAKRLRKLMLRNEFSDSAGEALAAHAATVPSRNDIVRLQSQVDALAEVVDQLLRQREQ
jgi:polyhydroxyalkanoate synthesis repressor PhaR